MGMKVLIDGKLAATVSKSLILGLTSREVAGFYERAYKKLFPAADVTVESEWPKGGWGSED